MNILKRVAGFPTRSPEAGPRLDRLRVVPIDGIAPINYIGDAPIWKDAKAVEIYRILVAPGNLGFQGVAQIAFGEPWLGQKIRAQLVPILPAWDRPPIGTDSVIPGQFSIVGRAEENVAPEGFVRGWCAGLVIQILRHPGLGADLDGGVGLAIP